VILMAWYEDPATVVVVVVATFFSCYLIYYMFKRIRI